MTDHVTPEQATLARAQIDESGNDWLLAVWDSLAAQLEKANERLYLYDNHPGMAEIDRLTSENRNLAAQRDGIELVGRKLLEERDNALAQLEAARQDVRIWEKIAWDEWKRLESMREREKPLVVELDRLQDALRESQAQVEQMRAVVEAADKAADYLQWLVDEFGADEAPYHAKALREALAALDEKGEA